MPAVVSWVSIALAHPGGREPLCFPEVDARLRRPPEVLERAGEFVVRLRVLGGVAVGLHTPEGVHPALARPYRDLDLATTRKEGRAAAALLAEVGYSPNERFNAMNGVSRLVFYDEEHGRQVDVFVGTFEMCHALPLTDRLDAPGPSLPATDLLMTKLQIVELNAKDRSDLYALLAGCPDGAIEPARVAGLTARGRWPAR